MAGRRSYSNQRTLGHKRSASDVLFDQVIGTKRAFEDSTDVEDIKQKKCPKRQKGRKMRFQPPRLETKEDDASSPGSLNMFELDEIPNNKKLRKKVSKSKQTQGRGKMAAKNKRLWTQAKNGPEGDESQKSSCESPGTSPSLNIETCNTRKSSLPTQTLQGGQTTKGKRKKKNRDTPRQIGQAKNKRGSSASNDMEAVRTDTKHGQANTQDCWTWAKDSVSSAGDQSSIELARDASVIPISLLRRGSALGGKSPPLLLVPSDIDDDSVLDNTEPKFSDEDDKEEIGWVTISSGPRDPHSFIGDFQYTYVSTYTYTYGSTTTTETKGRSKSPTVLLHALPDHLNSTVRRGKSDISDAEFPDFISPIFGKKGTASLKGKSRQTSARKSAYVGGDKDRRKCSTLLLESNSCPHQLESVGLTAIPSGTVQDSEQKKKESPSTGTAKVVERQWSGNKLCASTPKDRAIQISLSMSPVQMPTWDEDELGPRIDESLMVNTSEIIVPSMMEPTVSAVSQNEDDAQDSKRSKIAPADPSSPTSPGSTPDSGLADDGHHSRPGLLDSDHHSSSSLQTGVKAGEDGDHEEPGFQMSDPAAASTPLPTQDMDVVTCGNQQALSKNSRPKTEELNKEDRGSLAVVDKIKNNENGETLKQTAGPMEVEKKLISQSCYELKNTNLKHNQNESIENVNRTENDSLSELNASCSKNGNSVVSDYSKGATLKDKMQTVETGKHAQNDALSEFSPDNNGNRVVISDTSKKTTRKDKVQNVNEGKDTQSDAVSFSLTNFGKNRPNIIPPSYSADKQGNVQRDDYAVVTEKQNESVELMSTEVDSVVLNNNSPSCSYGDRNKNKREEMDNTRDSPVARKVSDLPLCFVNRLCMQHHQNQKIISTKFRFSVSSESLERNE